MTGGHHHSRDGSCRSAHAHHSAAHDKHVAHQHGTPTKVKAAEKQDVPPGTIYTCPMHPQIRQVGPGHCPICGMALEPLMPTAVKTTGADAVKRFWIRRR